MDLNRRRDFLLLGFVALSLLVHLSLLVLLPDIPLRPAPVTQEPVVVEVRPLERKPEPRERETDLLPEPEPAPNREKPAERLGPTDRVVERETAPRGDMPEDRRPDAPGPAVSQAPPVVTSAEPEPPPAAVSAPLAENAPRPQARPERERPPPTPDHEQAAEIPADIRSLLQLPQSTVARLEDEWRRKYRKDVEEGETVWLDTETDVLISFFRRLKDHVYGVWNYPRRAVARGEEGTCLVRITVNRDGSLRDVRLMESSGYPALDNEAVEAVRKGAPFGPLPRAYQGESLNIFTFFEYRLSRRLIY